MWAGTPTAQPLPSAGSLSWEGWLVATDDPVFLTLALWLPCRSLCVLALAPITASPTPTPTPPHPRFPSFVCHLFANSRTTESPQAHPRHHSGWLLVHLSVPSGRNKLWESRLRGSILSATKSVAPSTCLVWVLSIIKWNESLVEAGIVAPVLRLRKGTLSQEAVDRGFELVFDFKAGVFWKATL